ncbi:DUF4349 domain-containing protein [Glycomyces paridis]|uniref:DUF4349 domain-containing protein n=1 Tax=Glycomyces paridis TaxID=2126555 RepID=A0A4S8PCR5_9ACTN|nr:DUF4349 domain-containing protein [Glycomyces paridis]THV26039.1 DUF4349 domain-containing protein [Glycomyces paridis]
MRLFRKSIVAVSAALLLAGCSSSAGDGGGEAAPEAADEQGAVETNAPADAQVPAEERAVIYEATLGVRDEDPEKVAEDAWDLTESLGGFVTEDRRERTGDEETASSSARMVLRIPSASFAEAMDALVALADDELDRTVTTEDVTEAAVDLASHIETKRASVERVRELLAEADSVQAILDLETELANREGDLAALESQLADLQDRVAFSTIEFTVTAPPATEAEPEPAGYQGPENFWDGLVAGTGGALNVLVAVSVVLGVLLPFLPIAALVAAAIVVPIRLSRRRRERLRADPAPARFPFPAAPVLQQAGPVGPPGPAAFGGEEEPPPRG